MSRRLGVRTGLIIALGCLLASACDKPTETARSVPAAMPEASRPLAEADAVSSAPYTGEWAAAANHCADEKQVWTIEAHRMAIVPAMRFCAFKDIYVNTAPGKGTATFSAAANCLAEGRETQDFVFFRVQDNLREMRVTFNDTDAVKLVRCPIKS